MEGIAEKVSVSGEGGPVELPSIFDLIIMNPPFTRATGRVGVEFEEKEKGLFGFLADESLRKEVKKKYDKVRNKVREDLIKFASVFFKEESLSSDIKTAFLEIISEKRKKAKRKKDENEENKDGLKQYFSIGQAGEGFLFLYLAYKYVKSGGVIAFVLPRSVLAGISWFLARVLLASKFHLKYVIVSSDPYGYNFSEGTSLSEALIVAKKVGSHEDEEETIFVYLLR